MSQTKQIVQSNLLPLSISNSISSKFSSVNSASGQPTKQSQHNNKQSSYQNQNQQKAFKKQNKQTSAKTTQQQAPPTTTNKNKTNKQKQKQQQNNKLQKTSYEKYRSMHSASTNAIKTNPTAPKQNTSNIKPIMNNTKTKITSYRQLYVTSKKNNTPTATNNDTKINKQQDRLKQKQIVSKQIIENKQQQKYLHQQSLNMGKKENNYVEQNNRKQQTMVIQNPISHTNQKIKDATAFSIINKLQQHNNSPTKQTLHKQPYSHYNSTNILRKHNSEHKIKRYHYLQPANCNTQANFQINQQQRLIKMKLINQSKNTTANYNSQANTRALFPKQQYKFSKYNIESDANSLNYIYYHNPKTGILPNKPQQIRATSTRLHSRSKNSLNYTPSLKQILGYPQDTQRAYLNHQKSKRSIQKIRLRQQQMQRKAEEVDRRCRNIITKTYQSGYQYQYEETRNNRFNYMSQMEIIDRENKYNILKDKQRNLPNRDRQIKQKQVKLEIKRHMEEEHLQRQRQRNIQLLKLQRKQPYRSYLNSRSKDKQRYSQLSLERARQLRSRQNSKNNLLEKDNRNRNRYTGRQSRQGLRYTELSRDRSRQRQIQMSKQRIRQMQRQRQKQRQLHNAKERSRDRLLRQNQKASIHYNSKQKFNYLAQNTNTQHLRYQNIQKLKLRPQKSTLHIPQTQKRLILQNKPSYNNHFQSIHHSQAPFTQQFKLQQNHPQCICYEHTCTCEHLQNKLNTSRLNRLNSKLENYISRNINKLNANKKY